MRRLILVTLIGLNLSIQSTRSSKAEVKSARVAELILELGDDDYDTRERASKELVQLGGTARPAVAAAIKHRDHEIRLRARRIVEQIDTLARINKHIDLLQHRSADVRKAAAVALGDLGAKESKAIAALRESLKDKDEYVRNEAATSLLLLGEDKGLDSAFVKEITLDGKYSKLLRRIRVKHDFEYYGDMREFGYWFGSSYGDHDDLPPGYWVYKQPQWYIWGACRD